MRKPNQAVAKPNFSLIAFSLPSDSIVGKNMDTMFISTISDALNFMPAMLELWLILSRRNPHHIPILTV